MTRPALASVDDLEQLLGEVVANPVQADARLAQASELVRAYAGIDWLNAEGTDVENVPGAIPGVVAGIVERASRNPDGITQENAGPFGRSFGSDAASRIYLTDADKRIIRYAAGTGALGVIGTTRGPIETGTVLDCWALPTEGLAGFTEADEPYALWP